MRFLVVAFPIALCVTSPLRAEMSQTERISQLLGTVRVLADRCKITGEPQVLFKAVRGAGFEPTDFVPTGKYWRFTQKAMDQRFSMIADQGLGSACNIMNEVVHATIPGY